MPRRKSLSDIRVASLKPRADRYTEPDPELRGHYVRVHPSGAKSFVAVARDPAGKQVWATLGGSDHLSVDEARERARVAVERIKKGLPAFEAERPGSATFAEVAAGWLKRHVEAGGFRSRRKIEGLLTRHVLPVWGQREIAGIRRSDLARLLDDVEDHHGARQADLVLATVRSVMAWRAKRDDDFVPCVVKGMARQVQKLQARTRILSDSEIRAVWHVAETSGVFGAIVRVALLTGARRSKIGSMKWADLSADGKWSLGREPREKDNAGSLVLPEVALGIIRSQPRIGVNPYVFAGRGEGPFENWGKAKRAFDAKLPAGFEPWVVHDLRRTSRSLMSRAGVSREHAERVLGHTLTGVEHTYDRHHYSAEKERALRALAALIGSIINPPASSNVVQLRGVPL